MAVTSHLDRDARFVYLTTDERREYLNEWMGTDNTLEYGRDRHDNSVRLLKFPEATWYIVTYSPYDGELIAIDTCVDEDAGRRIFRSITQHW